MVEIVRVAEPPELVTVTGLVAPKLSIGRFCAPCGDDVIAADKDTVPTKPPEPLIERGSVALPPGVTEIAVDAGVSVMPGAAFTVRAMVVAAVRLPEVPVIVMAVGPPMAAAALAVNVRTLVAAAGLVAKVAATPEGRPLAVKVTAPEKAFVPVMVMVSVPLFPWPIAREAADGAMVKPGGALTVRGIVVEAVSVPEVPVTVTVAAPTDALALAVSVKTLELLTGLVAKLAVTPLGRPDAVSVTLPTNPLAAEMVMVSVPLAP